jgi:hypothetical protein
MEWSFDGVTAGGEDWSCLPTEQARAVLRGASDPARPPAQ